MKYIKLQFSMDLPNFVKTFRYEIEEKCFFSQYLFQNIFFTGINWVSKSKAVFSETSYSIQVLVYDGLTIYLYESKMNKKLRSRTKDLRRNC